MSLTPTTSTFIAGAQTFGGANISGNNSSTVNNIKMNTNILNNDLRCTSNNIINTTPTTTTTIINCNIGQNMQRNNNSIGSVSGQQLYQVIPIAANNVNSLQLGAVNVQQNATLLNNKCQNNNQAITIPAATVATATTMKMNCSSSNNNNNNQNFNRDIQTNIAQIIGTTLPMQNIVNKYGVAAVKPVQGLTVVQTAIAPVVPAINAINATNATLIQLPTTGNLQRVLATATAPALSTMPTAAATFSMINPNANSKLQTNQFVINSGSPKPTTITINPTAIAATLPAKTKIVEIKSMDMEMNKPAATIVATSQAHQHQQQQQQQQMSTPTSTTTTITTNNSILLPKANIADKMHVHPISLSASMAAPYTGVCSINAVTSRSNTNNAVPGLQINEISLEKLLPETTITKEPITITTASTLTSTSTSSTGSATKPIVTNAATVNDAGSLITKNNSLTEDLDKSQNMLIIDDSSDAESITNNNDEDDVENEDVNNESDGANSASDELSKSPPRIRHISNSVVLTKADTRSNVNSRSISSEPASVVLMKLPKAMPQTAGGGGGIGGVGSASCAKPQNVAIPINEALTMAKEHLMNVEPRPILLTRSNSIPEAQKTLSPRATKRSQSLNCGTAAKSNERDQLKVLQERASVDENIDKSNDDLNKSNPEITFIELYDSFDEDYTDESESAKTTPTKSSNNKNNNNNRLEQTEQKRTQLATVNSTTTLDKNDNIKSSNMTSTQVEQHKPTQLTSNSQKSQQQLHKHSVASASSITFSDENDEQMMKSLFCNEQITAITPSSSSSGSSLQEISPKLSSNSNLANTSSRSNMTSRQPPPPPTLLQSAKLATGEKTTSINNKNTNLNAATKSNAIVGTPNANARRLCSDNNIASALSMVSTFDMLNWKEDRVGTARGTAMRFELNEFNLLQVHERNCPKRFRIHTAYERPIYFRTSGLTPKTDHSDPMLYMCRKCKKHGPAVDFLAPEFCSYVCLRRTGTKRTAQTSNEVVNVDTFDTKRARKNAASTSMPSTSETSRTSKANATPYASTNLSLPKFRWSTYLAAMRSAYAAPIDLFLNPFPTGPNPFSVGMKLEAIDPENCSLFCVCTVAQIQGYRMRLNFDGYDSIYDFWVNADSMDIFPAGWCEKTKRILQPPRNYSTTRQFSWNDYLKKTNSVAADKKLFTHLNGGGSMTNRNPFQIGMFLEADDLNDTGKLCVASVADVLDERIRVHFDGWDDCYDYWVDISSPYIHPCGWHEGRQQLLVPPEYGNTSFNWREYIHETNTGSAAPEDFFVPRDPIDYRPGMKLEVVDPRNLSLIRPASVVHRTRHRVKIIFDCWPMDYTFVLEDDSPDLHPIGWCDATGHELEPPPGYQQFKKVMPCCTPGCRGIGNMNRNNGRSHATREACPYAAENWRTKCEKTPRVEGKQILRAYPTHPTAIQPAITTNIQDNLANNLKATSKDEQSKQTSIETLPSVPIKYPTRGRPRKVDRQVAVVRQQELQALERRCRLTLTDQIKIERPSIDEVPVTTPIATTPQIKIEAVVSNGISAHKSSSTQALEPHVATVKRFLCDYGPRLQQNYALWRENLAGIDIISKVQQNPLFWTTGQACDFLIDALPKNVGCDVLKKFSKHDIDGAALLMLQQQDLTDTLEFKLGPALKIYAIILQLRILVATKYESDSNTSSTEESNKNSSFESETECSVK